MATLSGGDKLEAKLKEMADKLAGSSTYKIGFHEGNYYDDKNHTPVAAVAFWNEYGTVKTPPRPFFRTAISENTGNWARMIEGFAKQGLIGDDLLDQVAYQMREDIKQSIITWTTPANAPYTIEKKGFNSPLRDTMQMYKSVEIEKS